MRRTKIICTLGPNAEDYNILKEISKVMDVARFNFSHGSYDEHKRKLELLKKVREELHRPIPALLDTKGPEIRTGMNENGEKIKLVAGEKIILSIEDCMGNKNKIFINYDKLINDVKENDKILIDDGLIELKVLKVLDTYIECEIVVGGELGEHKGVNVPGIKIELPSLTEKDKQDILFGIKEGFDIIAASFVRDANCIRQIRELLNENNSKMLIIAKIENSEGIENLDEIIDEADGIMVARGDLGVEVSPSEVPHYQKEMIKKCNQKGKIVITATQMLDSMIRNKRPTRAEVADVANAIYDGTDCIMLSGETANGKYPIESVKMMEQIAIDTEKYIDYNRRRENEYQIELNPTITTIVCKNATLTANALNAKAIVCPTASGRTAKVISKYKPIVPVYALSDDEVVVRQLMIYYAVTPMLERRSNNTDELVDITIKRLKRDNILKVDDVVVLTFSFAIAEKAVNKTTHTNCMRVHTVY